MGNTSRILIGKTNDQHPFYIDLDTTPSILMAGSTGSGKSNLFHVIIDQVLSVLTHIDWRLVLIDPKQIELSIYKDIPFLFTPFDTRLDVALTSLQKVVAEIEKRKGKTSEDDFQILVAIDEFSDLMCNNPVEIEKAIQYIVKEGAHYGVRIIISTSSPREEVYPKSLRDVFDTRIAGQLGNERDSLTVLGITGAELLSGSGDMLYVAHKGADPVRFQADYIPYEAIVEKATAKPICVLHSYESRTLVQKLAYKLGKLLP